MINIAKAEKETLAGLLKEMRERASGINSAVNASAAEILEQVRLEGYEAVCRFSKKFDGNEPYEISPQQLREAADKCPAELRKAMELAAENIRDYQARLLPQSSSWRVGTKSTLGQVVRGLDRVGIYVPGGRAAYPSSVLMNAIPAKVAGVREIVMVTPPTENLNNAVMAAALIAGVDRVIAVGGVQAIGALAYGAGSIPKVDKIVGPGNAYVAAAKRMMFGQIDIDMVAGPSEVLVIADETGNPQFIAADMLSQAEHDPLASAVLLTTSQQLAGKVAEELERQTALLTRRDIIESSLQNYGQIIICEDLAQAVEIGNAIAPEHLELMVSQPEALLPDIKNAGAVFVGEYSPEPLGDYIAGPSHVLPTSGTARFFSPLSVDSFLKKMSVINYCRSDLEAVSHEIQSFAESESLTAHANSVKIRFE